MKGLQLVLIAVLMLAVVGCGVKQSYVDQQIQESESRMNAKINNVESDTEQEIAKLRDLADKLSSRVEMAVNEAKGFENYQVIWSGEINFEFDSWDVTDAAAMVLNEAGEVLEQNPGSLIEIAGHADRTGNAKYNLMLGEKRAQAAKRYLADRFGTSLYRMFIISYGEERPVAMPDERGSASKNRRVTLKIWGQMQG
ncbi:OmpA family protein [candidate division GN15 bacterium]|nr:OmpA family protein [candidate division GN15 bacterium]